MLAQQPSRRKWSAPTRGPFLSGLSAYAAAADPVLAAAANSRKFYRESYH
ncbi:hypothetical protein J2S55_005705 [Streptosporangium brasiliense]|uniref:Uncharacterized protein n=1 Tax=Streptosporangium brasiliense TaxID=47480 RepID=A0ABT9RB08_9ACTN|nr:hypothetical protein [Streptosporangium brasiliense]